MCEMGPQRVHARGEGVVDPKRRDHQQAAVIEAQQRGAHGQVEARVDAQGALEGVDTLREGDELGHDVLRSGSG
jgi:hypothetical protein